MDSGYVVRYVLAVRGPDGVRLGTLSTEKHLWELRGLHFSLLRQFRAAQTIDVVSYPYAQPGTIDEQEAVATAQRADRAFTGIMWLRDRDLKEMERELEEKRKVEGVQR